MKKFITIVSIVLCFTNYSCNDGSTSRMERIAKMELEWELQKSVFNSAFMESYFKGEVKNIEIKRFNRASVFKIVFNSDIDFSYDDRNRMLNSFISIKPNSLSYIYTVEDLYEYSDIDEVLIFSAGDSIYKFRGDTTFYLKNINKSISCQGGYPLSWRINK